MIYEDILPLVLPYVKGCPESAALSAVVRCAREFCRKTRVWNYYLNPLANQPDQDVFPLVMGDAAEPFKVLAVDFDGQDYLPMEGTVAQQNVREGRGNIALFDPDARTVTLCPAPGYQALVNISVAVQPADDLSVGLPSVLRDEADFIADGAIAFLCKQPGTWANPAIATDREAAYRNRMAIVAARVSRTLPRPISAGPVAF